MEDMKVNLQDTELAEYIVQAQTCVNCYCGLCVSYCPAFEEAKDESVSARGLAQIVDALKRGEINLEELSDDVIYSCTGCRWCEWNCSLNTPIYITEHGDRRTKISGATMTELMRSMKVERGRIPQVIKDALDNIARVGNPYGMSKDGKDKWVEGLDCKFNGEDTLLYVGSMVPYEDRSTQMAEALIELLNKANFKFSMIGGDEADSGSSARYMGEEGLFAELVEKLAAIFEEKGVKQVICLSPHDYDTFVSCYGMNGNIKFKHYTEVLLELIKDKRIELRKNLNKIVTYHDPCYLGRKLNIYEPPREVLKSISGLKLVEMERNREMAYCCSGGGTGLWYELPRFHMNYTRVDQARDKEPNYLAVACPICLQMLDDGIKTRNYDFQVKDVAQIVLEAL